MRGSGEAPKRRLDASLLVVGGLLSGGLALVAAVVFDSWLGSDSGTGPTAATLNQAFSEFYGAAVGLAVGAACVAFAASTNAPLLTGLLAGLFGYVVVLAPAIVVTAPSDVTVADSIETAAFVALLLSPAVLLGAVLGASLARRNTGLGRRSR